MKQRNNRLILQQLDKKLLALQPLKEMNLPESWVKQIRKAFNMSLGQLGHKMLMTPQSVRDLERREAQGTISLKTLKVAAEALDMTLVYGLVPKDGSFEKLIERKAHEMAEKIVSRTSNSMRLEDQENSSERMEQAIEDLAGDLKKEMPKSLWD
ncbi:MAG TPA: mobile mystery protein A [Puia sp.]|nr:mobile mystery protein A [Puia sp.]